MLLLCHVDVFTLYSYACLPTSGYFSAIEVCTALGPRLLLVISVLKLNQEKGYDVLVYYGASCSGFLLQYLSGILVRLVLN